VALVDKLERALGRFAIPNLCLYLVFGQVAVVFAAMFGFLDPDLLRLAPVALFAGQWWRIVTFVFIPPYLPSATSLTTCVFVVFAWWIFYFMGNALEHYWGTFRFNLFLFVGYALTVGLSFITPESLVTNEFLAGSVFLAFAYLNPNFELVLFFILPVKIRWLALLSWIMYAYSFAVGGWSSRLQIAAAIGNFFLFFGRDLWQRAGAQRRRMAGEAATFAQAQKADEFRHRCRICGKTDVSNPELDFRYCSKCAGEQCYCPEHIFNHEHVLNEDEPRKG
jgi:hypothetical protein